MVLINCFNDHIPGSSIHLVCSIGIYCYLIVIFIQSISIRCIYFLNAVMSYFKILRKNQISLLICKIGFMFYRSRISCYLLHIFLSVHVENLELCILLKHCLFRLIILFDDFQFRFKLVIQKHSPCLWLVRVVLSDTHCKIIYRSIIVRCCSFTHNISSIWKCDTASITLFICEHFCCTILPNHNWCRRSKIIASVCFLRQGRFQICRKSGTF